MAEHTPNRKSDRNFNLDKGGQHTFDLEKKTTRKFELDKEDDPLIGITTDENHPGDGTGKGGSKKWIFGIIIAIGIVAAVLIAFFCVRGCDSKTESTPNEPQVEAPTQPMNDVSPDAENAMNTDIADDTTSDASESNDNLGADEIEGATSSYPTGEGQSQEPINAPTTQPQNATSSTSVSSDIEAEALNVIQGAYGNAPVRYDLLKQKGLDPAAIQRRVNEMKRQGVF